MAAQSSSSEHSTSPAPVNEQYVSDLEEHFQDPACIQQDNLDPAFFGDSFESTTGLLSPSFLDDTLNDLDFLETDVLDDAEVDIEEVVRQSDQDAITPYNSDRKSVV